MVARLGAALFSMSAPICSRLLTLVLDVLSIQGRAPKADGLSIQNIVFTCATGVTAFTDAADRPRRPLFLIAASGVATLHFVQILLPAANAGAVLCLLIGVVLWNKKPPRGGLAVSCLFRGLRRFPIAAEYRQRIPVGVHA